jgi:hypothetical protein
MNAIRNMKPTHQANKKHKRQVLRITLVHFPMYLIQHDQQRVNDQKNAYAYFNYASVYTSSPSFSDELE